LAKTLADWADEFSVIETVFLFGSRVRGDHRPDSDVDVRIIFTQELATDGMRLWDQENCSDFAVLKGSLPGPLALHQDSDDAALEAIQIAAKCPIFVDRKVLCVATPQRRA
jgi:predicted nucleotidyltransferase